MARAVGPTLEVYVWFEADPADDAAVRAALERAADSMIRGGSDPVRERPRLLRRPDLRLRDGVPRATWMEIWPGVPAHAFAGWVSRLEASAAAEGLDALARGGRHVEPFVPQPRPERSGAA